MKRIPIIVEQTLSQDAQKYFYAKIKRAQEFRAKKEPKMPFTL
jgi:hypothetical protein